MTALLADPRRVTRTEVHVGGRLAAHLTRSDEGVELRYTADYLDDPGPPIATTLPLTDAPVLAPAGAVPAFFAGLLPEGRRLTSLRNLVKTSADDELSLLIAVGQDPVGDVQVLLPGGRPALDAPQPAPEAAWGDLSFADILRDSALDPAALAGAQDKVSGRMLTVPLTHRGRQHLLKLEPPEHPGVVANEAAMLALARHLRQRVARSTVVHDRDGRSGLLVERFDRVPRADGLVRVAVEDAAQLLGRYPADKYALTTEAVLRRVSEISSAGLPAARAVLQQIALAWLTGNGDLHAKNISVMRVDGSWRPTPIYDIPSTLPYGDHRLALSIAGRDDSLSYRRWTTLAAGAGLPPAAADRALDEVLQVTHDAPEALVDALAPAPHVARRIARVLARRRRDLEP